MHRVDEFWTSCAPKTIDLPKAKEILDETKSSDAPATLVAFMSVRYDYAVKGVSFASEAMHRIIRDVIDQPIVDPAMYAKACVWATYWALMANNVETIVNLLDETGVLWATHSEDFDVLRWRPAIEQNAGACLMRNGRYDEAIACFESVFAHFDGDPAYACWLTKAHTQLAICYARLGSIDLAKAHARDAEPHGVDRDIHLRLHAWGEVALAEGDIEMARQTLRSASYHAKRTGDKFGLADIDLALCYVYKALYIITGNDLAVDAFWTTHESARSVALNDGVPHVLDALALVREGVPIIDGREVLNRCVRLSR